MTPTHWNVLLIYAAGLAVAVVLAALRRRVRPSVDPGSLAGKFPSYIAINLVFLAASWLPQGTHALTLLLAVLAALAAWELVRGLRPRETDGEATWKPWLAVLPVFSTALVVAADLLEPAAWMQALMIAFLVMVAASAIIGRPETYGRRALAAAGSLGYLPVCLGSYVWVWKGDPSGFQAVFLYLVVATNDAMAQITGELFGTRALAKGISPSKTVEGALGGALFAALVGAATGAVLGWGYVVGLGLGLLLAAAGLAGDLTASVWKRALGLRQFSTLLGAHGGVLDRFDSLLLAAPVLLVATRLLWG